LVSTTIRTTKSEEIFAAAQNLMSVSSPVRAFKSVGGQPIVFDRVKDAYVWMLMATNTLTTSVLGASNLRSCPSGCHRCTPRSPGKGTSFGAPSVLENVLAEMVIDAVPSIEMVRFVNPLKLAWRFCA